MLADSLAFRRRLAVVAGARATSCEAYRSLVIHPVAQAKGLPSQRRRCLRDRTVRPPMPDRPVPVKWAVWCADEGSNRVSADLERRQAVSGRSAAKVNAFAIAGREVPGAGKVGKCPLLLFLIFVVARHCAAFGRSNRILFTGETP